MKLLTVIYKLVNSTSGLLNNHNVRGNEINPEPINTAIKTAP